MTMAIMQNTRLSNFSEFWINGGGARKASTATGAGLFYRCTSAGDTALLQWKTLQETNTDRYIIEKRR